MTETPDDHARHNARMKRLSAAREKMMARRTLERGLLIVHTGNGKGKSSSAFGMAIRSLGWGMKVAILQYVKGKWETGERNFFEGNPDLGDVRGDGRGLHLGHAGPRARYRGGEGGVGAIEGDDPRSRL